MSDAGPNDTPPDDAGGSGEPSTGDTPAGEHVEHPGASATERAQTEPILKTVSGVAAYPDDWRGSSDGVRYFYRRGTVLVRSWHVPDVQELLPGLAPGEGLVEQDVTGSLTRLRLTGPRADVSVERLVRGIQAEYGPDAADFDYLAYVCGHCCAAIEQEEVPADATPVPRPRTVEDATDPWCGRGKGVDVLVVDTGLVANATDHSWMRGVEGELEDPVHPGTGLLAQDGGHGTFVAGCLRSAAPEAGVRVLNAAARLPLVKGAGPVGAVFASDLAQLVRSQLVAGPGEEPVAVPDILLLNFAFTTETGGPPLAFDALYDDVIQHLKELVIVCPAGNEGDARKNWPASFSWVVSVGGLAENWRDRATWSNYGRTVDVYAPGDRLVNAYARGTYECTWEDARGERRTFDGMALWSGTSFAAPLVAGTIAARMSTTGQNSRRAWRSLHDLAERRAVPGIGPVLYPGEGCGAGPGCGCGCHG